MVAAPNYSNSSHEERGGERLLSGKQGSRRLVLASSFFFFFFVWLLIGLAGNVDLVMVDDVAQFLLLSLSLFLCMGASVLLIVESG